MSYEVEPTRPNDHGTPAQPGDLSGAGTAGNSPSQPSGLDPHDPAAIVDESLANSVRALLTRAAARGTWTPSTGPDGNPLPNELNGEFRLSIVGNSVVLGPVGR